MTNTLQKILHGAYESTYSSFYRDVYTRRNFLMPGGGFPMTDLDWQKVPFLHKEDIVRAPLADRVFVPWNKVDVIRMTSGTTGNLLAIPRNRIVSYEYQKDISGITTLLSFVYPHHFTEKAVHNAGLHFVGADPANLAASAKLAGLLKVDALLVMPSVLFAFIPYLQKECSFPSIKLLELYGERCSQAEESEIKKFFPNAFLLFEYGSMEMHGVSGFSGAFDELGKCHYQPLGDEFLWEVIDIDTGEAITSKREGELVVTTLWEENAFPLIRYRTGDLAIRHDDNTFEILGRINLDRVKVVGGELRTDELRRTFSVFQKDVDANFEAHIYWETRAGSSKPQLIIHVLPLSKKVDLDTLAKNIATTLRLAPEFTYAMGVKHGLYLPLRCALLSTGKTAGKRQYLFNHR